MISYIKGQIAYMCPTHIIVEASGIGYHINISLYTYAQIEKLEQIKIFTHYHIKEDAHTLYGFSDEMERALFGHLLSVNGVGPNTARLLLSGMSPDEVRSAIISEQEIAFKKVKGIGPKTAKQIILDLKDKLIKDGGADVNTQLLVSANNIHREEALSALLALGFSKIQVQKILNKIIVENPTINNVEQLIKLSLKQLS
ncbi:MAG: Holliday junction branch migration protein RuvA [Saprospiraceae bacterium]|nr:Holliday junction branch migration protein RuvA [Saprospiraceae bacterium]